MNSTITIKHKIPNGLRTIKLRTKSCGPDSFDFERDGATILMLPPNIFEHLSMLLTLPLDDSFEMSTVKAIKPMLENWLHEQLPLCSKYSLRHLIVRNSHASKGLMNRKQLPVQKPGQFFHIDQEHSDLVNIWLPLTSEPLTDFQLGFIKYQGILLNTVGLKEVYKKDKKTMVKEFEKKAVLEFPSNLSYGHAVIFRSGGKNAVVHGSFRFDGEENQTGSLRTSMEWRCQVKDPINGFGPSQML